MMNIVRYLITLIVGKDTPMYTIAGLGNPGEEYSKTRHNIGRQVADAFIKKNALPESVQSKKYVSLISSDEVLGEKVLVLMPETFMNKSGSAIKIAVTSEKKAEKLIVIHDDLDLPIGSMKISFGRGAGGHRGVESIIKNINTKNFVRLRVGISPQTPGGKLKKPKGDVGVTDFVISEFKKNEVDEIKKVIKKAVSAIEMILSDGREKATGVFNQ